MANASAVCSTPACIHAASEYLYNLSPNRAKIDACSNFEEFVCDGWKPRHEMRPDEARISAFDTMSDIGREMLHQVLEKPYPGDSNHSAFSPRNLEKVEASVDQQNFDLLQQAYKACMDEKAISSAGITPLVKLLDGLATTFKSDDYADTSVYLSKIAGRNFISYGPTGDAKNPDVQVLQVRPTTGIGLGSKKFYADKKIVAQYQDAVTNVLGAVHPTNLKGEDLAKHADAIVKLESKISALNPDSSDMSDPDKLYNPMPLNETVKLIPQLGLDRVFKALVPANYTPEIVITSFPHIIANISSILSETPKEVIQAFYYLKVIQSYATNLLAPEVKPYQRFTNILNGLEPDAVPERWRTCLSHVDGGNSGLGWILSRFYIEVAFSAKAKEFGDQIISDVKQTYLKKLSGLSWMDDDVKKVAAEKVKNIDQKVGYPTKSPNIMDPQAVHDYYAPLNLTANYIDNILSFDRFVSNESWSGLGKPTDMQRWTMTAPTVNAYYNPTHNEIVFPAGIMQLPMFSSDLPSYISYGGFGAVAGHELSHGFDNHGRLYDQRGAYRDWWTNKTVAEYNKRADCIEKQFSNFTVVGKDGPIHVDGKQTLGENIADSAGISAAFAAWQDRRKASGSPDQRLPGLESFTPEQMFYVAFGNVWCSKWKPAALTNLVLTNAHSPEEIRIKGTMMNSRGFREAFNCPVKEPTCEMW